VLTPLTNDPREYSWGSPTLIAALEGRQPTGRPEAEVWFGTHPASPARTADGRTLDVVLREAGQPPLPFLVKILAADRSLSIQVHPSKEQAVAGFAREEAAGIPRDADERTYRDDNHKPEIIVALSERFRALVGLRPLAETRRLLELLGGPGPAELADRLSGDDESRAVRDALQWVMSDASRPVVDDIVRALTDGSRDDGGEFAEERDVLRRIAADFPSDPGILVALLMNLVVLRRGEALFAPAGVLHAYQDGLGVEIMASSDNVVRGGLTPKHVDVPELLRLVDATTGPAPRVAVQRRDNGDVYDVGVPDFELTRAEVRPGEERAVAIDGPTILLVTRGAVEVAAPGGRATAAAGRAVFASADEERVALSGDGEVFIARPGA